MLKKCETNFKKTSFQQVFPYKTVDGLIQKFWDDKKSILTVINQLK